LKLIWLYIVRFYLSVGLFFYYKRIKVFNKKNVPKTGSLILVSNHNNALIDALLIATKSGRFSYFLTRASVFKKPMVNYFLRSLNMLPVYRIRDGWSTIANNNSIFTECSKILSRGKTVALFPEGNHNIKRTVRNLSKGFTRIVFETFEKYPNTRLQIVPIGLNFQKADAFADSVSIYFGEPIQKEDYFLNNKNESSIILKERVSEKIKVLTTHIPGDIYEESLNKLNSHNANFLEPISVNECIASNYENCSFMEEPKEINIVNVIFKQFLILSLLFPYLIWRFYIKPKIDEVEFVATFRFVIAITLVPIWMLVVGILIATAFNVFFSAVYFLLVIIFALLAIKL